MMDPETPIRRIVRTFLTTRKMVLSCGHLVAMPHGGLRGVVEVTCHRCFLKEMDKRGSPLRSR